MRRAWAIAAIAATLAGCGEASHPAPPPARRATRSRATPARSSTPAALPAGHCPQPFAATGGTPDLDQLASRRVRVSSASSTQINAALTAARRFANAYVPYTYAQARLSAISNACPALVAQLRDQPPVVPASVHARHPRILAINARGAIADQVAIEVTISDGQITYPIDVTAIQQPGGQWLLTLGW